MQKKREKILPVKNYYKKPFKKSIKKFQLLFSKKYL